MTIRWVGNKFNNINWVRKNGINVKIFHLNVEYNIRDGQKSPSLLILKIWITIRARAHWPLCLATGGRVFVADPSTLGRHVTAICDINKQLVRLATLPATLRMQIINYILIMLFWFHFLIILQFIFSCVLKKMNKNEIY